MNKKIVKLSVIGFVIAIFAIVITITDDNNTTYAVGTTLAQTVIDENPTGISTWESGASGVYKITYGGRANDYRYIGTNVDNYVKFNNDMYQIIGVFDENTHGKTGQQLVKLIRASILGAYSWGAYNNELKNGEMSGISNNWTGTGQTTPANLNILLNEYFYNKTGVSDIYGNCANWTYAGARGVKTNDCNCLIGYGIEQDFRGYIENTKWYLNGDLGANLTKENWYLCERGLYTECGPATNADESIETKIGLMYVSDYMYASGYYGDDDDFGLNDRASRSQNWLYNGSEFLLTPEYNNNTRVYYIEQEMDMYAIAF